MRDVYKTMPKSVRIGCFTYKVQLMSGDDGDVAGIAGCAHMLMLKIRIRDDMPDQQVVNTFVHEVLHAIHNFHGLTDKSDEEEFTNLGANGVCAFWQDNPEAIAWINSILRKTKK